MRKIYFTTTKKLIVLLLIVGILLSLLCIYRGLKIDSIRLSNTCKIYVELYLKQMSTNKNTVSDIDQATEAFLNSNEFDSCIFFTYYNKQYIKDVGFINSVFMKDFQECKQMYFNEILILRLKTLAIQRKNDEYDKLFNKYIYDIEENIYTRNCYISYLINDNNYQIEWNDDLYKIIEAPLIYAYNESDDIAMQFYLLNEMILFYGSFEESAEQQDFYRKQLVELVKENKVELREKIG